MARRYGLTYQVAALALKAFSLNALTRHAYRKIGNACGGQSREAASIASRVQKSDEMRAAIECHAPFGAESHLFELGTGWMHWFALSLRIHHPGLRVSTLDVWDNRQFGALQAGFRQLRAHYESQPRTPAHVLDALEVIAGVADFEELYAEMSMTHRIDPTGSLGAYEDGAFSHVVSADVLEHIDADSIGEVLADLHRTLRPGGLSVHQIGIDDHLTHFDDSKSEKEYLRFSERAWRLRFENRVQYFNRVQPSEWMAMFEQAGFECLDVRRRSCDITGLRVAAQFAPLPREDLECTRLSVVHRKPPSAA